MNKFLTTTMVYLLIVNPFALGFLIGLLSMYCSMQLSGVAKALFITGVSIFVIFCVYTYGLVYRLISKIPLFEKDDCND